LKAELRERGLSDEQIEQGLQELVIDWCEVASQVLEKKFGPEPPADVKEKARRLRFMQYRGFYQDHYQPLFPR
jgi:regulatory protein